MLRALGYLGSYRGGDARAWLLRIVRNTAYSALAARRRDNATSLDEGVVPGIEGEAVALQVPDLTDDPEAALARREALVQLDRALAELPAELRECLVLRELEELSYKEIAHITEVPVGTVMSRLWRARRALEAIRSLGIAPESFVSGGSSDDGAEQVHSIPASPEISRPFFERLTPCRDSIGARRCRCSRRQRCRSPERLPGVSWVTYTLHDEGDILSAEASDIGATVKHSVIDLIIS